MGWFDNASLTARLTLSGRPLILSDVLDKSDALLAAWLPGTEGQGVADALFGDCPPTGKLPCTWPLNMDYYTSKAAAKALFPYGFGLNYGAPETLKTSGLLPVSTVPKL